MYTQEGVGELIETKTSTCDATVIGACTQISLSFWHHKPTGLDQMPQQLQNQGQEVSSFRTEKSYSKRAGMHNITTDNAHTLFPVQDTETTNADRKQSFYLFDVTANSIGLLVISIALIGLSHWVNDTLLICLFNLWRCFMLVLIGALVTTVKLTEDNV